MRFDPLDTGDRVRGIPLDPLKLVNQELDEKCLFGPPYTLKQKLSERPTPGPLQAWNKEVDG